MELTESLSAGVRRDTRQQSCMGRGPPAEMERGPPPRQATKRRRKTFAETHAHWVCVKVSLCAGSSHPLPDDWQPSSAGIINERIARLNGHNLFGVDGICIFGRIHQDDSMLVLLTSSTGTMCRFEQQDKVHSWLNHALEYKCTASWPSHEAVSGLLQPAHPRVVVGDIDGRVLNVVDS